MAAQLVLLNMAQAQDMVLPQADTDLLDTVAADTAVVTTETETVIAGIVLATAWKMPGNAQRIAHLTPGIE